MEPRGRLVDCYCSVEGEQLVGHGTFRNFEIFTPANSPYWGEFFGSEKFQKCHLESGFPPEHFFQNSTIFSNKSHSCHHRGPFIGRKECTLPYMECREATDVLHDSSQSNNSLKN